MLQQWVGSTKNKAIAAYYFEVVAILGDLEAQNDGFLLYAWKGVKKLFCYFLISLSALFKIYY